MSETDQANTPARAHIAWRAGRRSRLGRREARDGYLMIMPFVLGFLFFTAGPMVFSLYIAAHNWDILTPPVFVGLSNVRKLLEDELVRVSLVNTAYYTFIGVPLHTGLALLVALAMNLKLYGIRLFRTLYYLPSILPTVASAFLWLWFFNPEYGLANAVLVALRLPPQEWLLRPALAKPVFITMSLWGIGGTMVILLAGLQGVPRELYEVAQIDGASAVQRFRHVTVPIITPVIFFVLVMQIIGSFQVFASAQIMTEGGPLNATLFYVLYLYRQGWRYLNMGYAASLAWLLFAIIMVFTWLQFRLGRQWVYYEAE